jgi:CheY-like chemotaxis protein
MTERPIRTSVTTAPARPADGARLHPLRALVVDDAPVNRELVAALLSPLNAEIVEAGDGVQAVEAAAREAFDFVLMDVQMPGMDGLAATRAIREGSALNACTPIIAVSASARPDDVAACHEAGMNDHVPKPISAQALLARIAAWTRTEPRPA